MDEFEYHLRKIGPSASCDKVPKFMRLHLGQTKIGRGQNNDYYLDSKKLKNFISRYHAEVIGKKNENGEIEFTLCDRGLNGTFINDIRTQSMCVLDVGDKLTFGHTNGYRIKPGEQANQPQSEFQFLFEQVPRNQVIDLDEENSRSADNVPETPLGESPASHNGNVERLCLSPNNRSNVLNPAQIELIKETNLSTKAAILDRDVTICGNGRLSPVHKEEGLSTSKGDEVDGAESSNESVNSLEKGSDVVNSAGISSDEYGFKLREDSLSLYSETLPDLEREEDQSILKSDDSVPTIPQLPCKGKVSRSESETMNMSDDSSLEEAAHESTVSRTSSKRGRGRGKGIAGSTGSRRKKRKKTGDGDVSDELEDGVEWYEEDTCASNECLRPKKKRTPWVQCDRCDEWYHTMCVGASYDKVKDLDIDFVCGSC